MKIYRIKFGNKIVTVKKEKFSNLSPQFISAPHFKFDTDEAYIRCSKKGKTKYYLKQHIAYPLSCEVVEEFTYDNAVVRLFKKAITLIP